MFDLFCIHPFRDGNGRVSRLATTLLLQAHGFQVARYVSLERLVEDSKEEYYAILADCSLGWHEGKNEILPWWNYFLSMLRRAYREFERQVESAEARPAKRSRSGHSLKGTHSMKWSVSKENAQGIALPPRASEPIRFAAAELRRYLGQILSVGLPSDQSGAGPTIVLETITDAELTDEGYEIAAAGSRLCIRGGGDAGVVYGVIGYP